MLARRNEGPQSALEILRRWQQPREHAPLGWSYASLRGILAELSAPGLGGGLLTEATLQLAAAQRQGGLVCLIHSDPAIMPYPPDLQRCGVDVRALLCVRLATPELALRAAIRVGQSSAFALILVDLCQLPWQRRTPPLSPPQVTPYLARLAAWCRKSEHAVLFLTLKEAEAPSLGPLITLRACLQAQPERGVDAYRVEVTKDKRGGPRPGPQRSPLLPSGLG